MTRNPLFDFDHSPDGRLHAKLMNPDWQAVFRLLVHAAYNDVREVLISMRVTNADTLEKIVFATGGLQRLREFLVESAENAGPYGFYAGPPQLKDAYLAACRMFAEMKERLDSGRNAVPIRSLAYIHAKLNGEDPAKLVRDAEDLWKAVAARFEPSRVPDVSSAEIMAAIQGLNDRLKRTTERRKLVRNPKTKRGKIRDQCVGHYWAMMAKGETPTAQAIAEIVGCNRATAWAAIKALEEARVGPSKPRGSGRWRREE
jgi:hypothetical protein